MKILMLGWELPPHNSGGLGVACLNMALYLSKVPTLTSLSLMKLSIPRSSLCAWYLLRISIQSISMATALTNLQDFSIKSSPRLTKRNWSVFATFRSLIVILLKNISCNTNQTSFMRMTGLLTKPVLSLKRNTKFHSSPMFMLLNLTALVCILATL